MKATKGATVVTSARSRVSEGIDGKDAVGLYLEGIAKTPLLTAEEEVELAQDDRARPVRRTHPVR